MENEIVKYSFVSAITGIIRTTVVFWIPTYLTQYIGFSATKAAGIFTVTTISISITPYINNLIVYERIFKSNKDKTLLFMFSLSAISFLLMFAVKEPVLNILFLCLAIMSANGAATILWSVYCPSLRDTGMVSTATGYLDFISYMSAAASNILFSNIVDKIGWGYVILIWCAIMAFGVVISLPFKAKSEV